MWALFSVDIRDVWEGAEDAGWVLGLIPHVVQHERSITAARINSGEDTLPVSEDTTPGNPAQWPEWYGYGITQKMLAMLTDVEASKGAGKAVEAGYRPTGHRRVAPKTAEEAYAALMAWGA